MDKGRRKKVKKVGEVAGAKAGQEGIHKTGGKIG